MCVLLIYAGEGSAKIVGWQTGDVVKVYPDNAFLGRRVSWKDWIAGGGDIADFPTAFSDIFNVLELPDTTVAEAKNMEDVARISGTGPGRDRRRRRPWW